MILNAYTEQKRKIDQNKIEFSTKWFGYLTPIEFGYILAKRAKKFKDNPVPYLKRDALEAWRLKWEGLAKGFMNYLQDRFASIEHRLDRLERIEEERYGHQKD